MLNFDTVGEIFDQAKILDTVTPTAVQFLPIQWSLIYKCILHCAFNKEVIHLV